MSTRSARRSAVAILAVSLVALGATAADAGLIGSTVDLKWYFPDSTTVLVDGGTKVVGAGVEYPALRDFEGVRVDVDVTDTQLIITNSGEDGQFTSATFNGFVLTIVSGPELFSAIVNPATPDFFVPFEVSFTADTLTLNYVGLGREGQPAVAGMPAGTSSIIDINTPEPATLVLVGSGVAALVARRVKRRRQS